MSGCFKHFIVPFNINIDLIPYFSCLSTSPNPQTKDTNLPLPIPLTCVFGSNDHLFQVDPVSLPSFLIFANKKYVGANFVSYLVSILIKLKINCAKQQDSDCYLGLSSSENICTVYNHVKSRGNNSSSDIPWRLRCPWKKISSPSKNTGKDLGYDQTEWWIKWRQIWRFSSPL